MYFNAVIDINAATNTTLVAAVPDQKIVVIGYNIHAYGDNTIRFQGGTTTMFTGDMQIIKGESMNPGGIPPYTDGTAQEGWFNTNHNQALVLNTSAAAKIGGHLLYTLRS